MKIKVIALMGKAGSGKDFILKHILAANPSYNELISCTTRPKRMGEVNGKNYYFISEDKFQELLDKDMMLEYGVFNSWYYGTSFDTLQPNRVNVGVFNPEGIRSLLKFQDLFDIHIYWIQAMPKTRMLRQLNREQNPDVNEIVRRYGADEADFANIDFEFISLINETPDDIADILTAIKRTSDEIR